MEKPCLFSEDKAKCFISNTALFLCLFIYFFQGPKEERALTFLILTVEFSCLSLEKCLRLLQTWNLELKCDFIYKNQIICTENS